MPPDVEHPDKPITSRGDKHIRVSFAGRDTLYVIAVSEIPRHNCSTMLQIEGTDSILLTLLDFVRCVGIWIGICTEEKVTRGLMVFPDIYLQIFVSQVDLVVMYAPHGRLDCFYGIAVSPTIPHCVPSRSNDVFCWSMSRQVVSIQHEYGPPPSTEDTSAVVE